jgi:heterodisulfide reductase subunit A
VVALTIDGRKVEAEPGTTIMEAAGSQGIKIPSLCYHKALIPWGSCRLCVVEVAGRPKLVASCAVPVEEGIEVRTDSPRVVAARRLVSELLLLRCPEVPQIQELASEMGADETRLKRFTPDHEDCILCGLCIRICKERMGINAVDFINRGPDRKVAPPFSRSSPICQTCGACESVCPTGAVHLADVTGNTPRPIPSEFNMGLVGRKPIYIPFPQAVPKVPVIDPERCVFFQRGVCQTCASFCEAHAIDYEQQEEYLDLDVGAVVVATGLDLYDVSSLEEYGYGKVKNVVTAMEYERLTSASGPTGGELTRPSDGKLATNIAFIQCVGSRDFKHMPYCSSVCCMYATKEAMLAYEHHPGTKSTIFYMDLRAVGKRFQEYLTRATAEYNVTYIRGRPASIEEAENGNPIIWYEDTAARQTKAFETDLVILSQALLPSNGHVAEALGIAVDEHGFVQIPDRLSHPLDSSRPGVFACGYAHSPRDIPDSVVQASGSAARVAEVLAATQGAHHDG